MTAESPDKPAKLDRNVAGMQVLSDIRGLISGTPSKPRPAEAPKQKKATPDPRVARLESEIATYREQVQKQQAELDRLKAERDALAARLAAAPPVVEKRTAPSAGSQRTSDEIAGLEERKAELTAALSDVEALLEVKTQDLLRRLANIFEEAGQSDFAQEIRRGRNGLQNPENLGSFLRAFLRQ